MGWRDRGSSRGGRLTRAIATSPLVAVALHVGTAAALAAPATAPSTAPAGRYVEPDLGLFLFERAQMRTTAADRARAAKARAGLATEVPKADGPVSAATAARALGVALRLDPQGREAVIANGLLRRGRTPQPQPTATWSRPDAIRELIGFAAACRRADTAADRAAAGYVLAVLLELEPANAAASAEAVALAADAGRHGGLTLDWSWAPGPPQAAGAGTTGRRADGTAGAAALAGEPVVISGTPVEVFHYKLRSAAALTAVFSADGRQVFSAGEDGSIHLWDAKTGADVRRFEGAGGYRDLTLSSDGKTLAGAGDEIVRLWDVESGKERLRLPWPDQPKPTRHSGPNPAYRVAIAVDGKRAVVADAASHGTVWDLEDARALLTLPAADMWKQERALAASPDGKWLAIAQGATIHLYDAATLQPGRKLVGDFYGVASCRFLPDSRRMLSVSGKTARLWDVATGQEVSQFGYAGDGARLFAIAVSPDGRHAATTG